MLLSYWVDGFGSFRLNFKGFKVMEAWRKSREFRIPVATLAKSFPKEEKHPLANQILRASRLIPANIAQGFGRFHHRGKIQFCRIARGPLYETLKHIICAFDKKYITEEVYRELRNPFNETLTLLNGCIAYLKKSNATQQPNNLIT